jgi:hypothetical protein
VLKHNERSGAAEASVLQDRVGRAQASGWETMSAHQIYFHLAWTTRDRRPMIDPPTHDFLNEFFRRTAA